MFFRQTKFLKNHNQLKSEDSYRKDESHALIARFPLGPHTLWVEVFHETEAHLATFLEVHIMNPS